VATFFTFESDDVAHACSEDSPAKRAPLRGDRLKRSFIKNKNLFDKKRLQAGDRGELLLIFPVGKNGRELAPLQIKKPSAGCCGVNGPNPQPLSIRDLQIVSEMLRFPARQSRADQDLPSKTAISARFGVAAFYQGTNNSEI
jgi:hypothetical protein